MRVSGPALLVVCLVLSLPAALRAAGSTFTEDVPVRGGVAALADAIPISPAPDRARFLAEAIRVVYSWPQAGPYSNEPMRRRIAAFFQDAPSGEGADDVPVPLTAAIWSQLLHRAVGGDELIGAILADRSASFVCYALSGADDETLQFYAEHPAVVARMLERAPAVFAAFGESVRVHDGRIAVPGGENAQPAWEEVIGERADHPDRFIQQLFETDRGRLAYLFDTLAHVDRAMATSIFGRSSSDPLKRLAALVRRGFPEWDVTAAPFVRPPADLAAFIGRMRATSALTPESPDLGAASFWQRVFGDAPNSSANADVAWMADAVLGHPPRERERRLDVFGFTQRVFGSSTRDDDVVKAAHAFGNYPVLMLTLERMNVRTPGTYVAAGQHAEKLTSLDTTKGSIALSQFQGAMALVERAARMRTIDGPTAEELANRLFSLRPDDGNYDGAVAAWLGMFAERVRSATRVNTAATIDDVILAAVAGPSTANGAAVVEWEGQRYRVDPGAAELQRLHRARVRQQTVSFATVLAVRNVAQSVTTSTTTVESTHAGATTLEAAATEIAAAEQTGDDSAVKTLREAAHTLAAITRAADMADARRAVAPLGALSDALLGRALVSLAYACNLGDPEGTILIAGDPARRHDYGFDLPGREARARAIWGVAAIETRRGPWHLVGSVLALDVAMAPLALRRISIDHVPDSPMLNLMHRDGFAAAVAVMNGAALSDTDRDRLAEFIAKGRERLRSLTDGREEPAAIARDIGLDGWRTRALSWTVLHDPRQTPSLFSMTELLVLGGGRPASFDAWGTYGLRVAGCLCSHLAEPDDWRYWWGLAQAGLPAILVSDLPLNVAVVLHNLHLPAVLAKPVLAAAMQDFIDGTNPTDGNDWLTLARAAQAIDDMRFEDYVAAATADGPLVADSDAK